MADPYRSLRLLSPEKVTVFLDPNCNGIGSGSGIMLQFCFLRNGRSLRIYITLARAMAFAIVFLESEFLVLCQIEATDPLAKFGHGLRWGCVQLPKAESRRTTEVKRYSKMVKRRTFIYNDTNKRIAEKCWLIRFYCLFLRNSYSFRSVLLLSFIILTHFCCCCCVTLRHIGDVVQFGAHSKRNEDNATTFEAGLWAFAHTSYPISLYYGQFCT